MKTYNTNGTLGDIVYSLYWKRQTEVTFKKLENVSEKQKAMKWKTKIP